MKPWMDDFVNWLMEDVPWWKFWDPRTGVVGGATLGLVIGAVTIAAVVLFKFMTQGSI